MKIPIGGGSYQRLLPRIGMRPILAHQPQATVLYYHPYDFGVTLPSPWSTRSPAVLKQVVGRGRIPAIVKDLLARAGSVTCGEAADGI